MARCIGAKGDALREVWGIGPLQWAHRQRSPAVRVLRGNPASHPTPNQVQAYHLPDAFRGDHPGGPDLWGWGNRCHLSRLSIVVPADGPFVHRRLQPQEVEGEPSALLLSLLIGILVGAGFFCGLYAIGSRTKAWMSLGLVARVVMAPLSFLALLRIRILGQSDDPAGQEGAPEPEKSPPER